MRGADLVGAHMCDATMPDVTINEHAVSPLAD